MKNQKKFNKALWEPRGGNDLFSSEAVLGLIFEGSIRFHWAKKADMDSGNNKKQRYENVLQGVTHSVKLMYSL